MKITDYRTIKTWFSPIFSKKTGKYRGDSTKGIFFKDNDYELWGQLMAINKYFGFCTRLPLTTYTSDEEILSIVIEDDNLEYVEESEDGEC